MGGIEATGGLETAIALGYWLSLFGFLLATVVTILAVRKFGRSILGSIFTYFLFGTGTFLAISVFQKLGGDFYGISDASMDIWWHLMFYLALISYYFGLRALVGLGTADPSSNQPSAIAPEKVWGLLVAAAVVIIFIIPTMADSVVVAYSSSNLSILGLHHFLAFIVAGVVGSYLFSAKKTLGQIGRAIANPMVIAIWAFGLQHVWELLYESWKVVDVTSSTGEGVEKLFVITASVCIALAAWRLRAFAQG